MRKTATQERWVYVTQPASEAGSQDTVHFLNLRDLKELRVGGREGKKFRGTARVQNQDHAVIVKEVGRRKKTTEIEVQNTVRVYAFLKKHGFPVPEIASYYLLTPEGKRQKAVYRIVLSDLTERGVKRLWGYSTKMRKAQLKELWGMKLSIQDILGVLKHVTEIAEKATSLEVAIPWFSYHLLREKGVATNLEVCLLDAGGHFLLDSSYLGDRLGDENLQNARKFVLQVIKYVCSDPQRSRQEKMMIQQLKYQI